MPKDEFELDVLWLRKLRKACRAWYNRHGRDLPWRSVNSAYAVWISEIMLQQTTIAAVIPYFERFLSTFPTVHDLAAAEESQVLRMWEGLGYYSRARNLHKAAQVISAEHDGQFPTDLKSLNALPGIGRYTAGAIRSFAFNLPAPIVEANTVRLYSRLLGMKDDPKSKRGQQRLWDFAEQIVTKNDPAALNSALMDIGSLICTPKSPDCKRCPFAPHCEAHRLGVQHEVPLKVERQKLTDVTEATIVLKHEGRYLLRQRTSEERWSGMWDFPRFPISNEVAPAGKVRTGSLTEPDQQLTDVLQTEMKRHCGLRIDSLRFLKELRHGVTRYRIRLLVLTAEAIGGELLSDTEYIRITEEEFDQYPLPVTGRKVAEFVTAPPPSQGELFTQE